MMATQLYILYYIPVTLTAWTFDRKTYSTRVTRKTSDLGPLYHWTTWYILDC